MITGYRTTQALYVAAKLGVADLLAEGPADAEALARRLGVQPGPLFRLLRFLAGHGFFTQDASHRFGLTPMGQALRTDDPTSVRYSAIMHGELHYQAAGALLHTIRTGETAFDHLYGKGLFDYLAGHPDDGTTFNLAMSDSHRVWRNLIEAYDFDFRGRKVVVDVGGGRGTLIAMVLRKNPKLRAILFDLPQGVAQAHAYLESQGVADRCVIRTGDAFKAVPSGGDVYLISRVLHDWSEIKGRQLLANVRKVIPKGGLLLLHEAVVPEGATPSLTKDIDLTMLFLLGGAERTRAEWESTLHATGFELVRVTKSGGMFDLIEAKPA